MKAAIRILLAGCVSGIFASTALCNYLLVKENQAQQLQICVLYTNELSHGTADPHMEEYLLKVCSETVQRIK